MGARFIKRGQRNLAILNVLPSDHERVAAEAAPGVALPEQIQEWR